jgi:GTPase SAR1 family protein
MSDIDEHTSPGVCRMFVGNKADLKREKVVRTDAGTTLATQYGIPFMETSAKDNLNIEKMFMTIARGMRDKEKAKTGGSPPATEGGGGGVTIQIGGRPAGARADDAAER